MKKRKRFLVGVGILVVSAVPVLLLGRAGEPPAPDEPPLTAVSVMRPIVEDVFEPVRYVGTLEGVGDASLGFRTSGTVAAVFVREGERVAAGARLAVLDQPEAPARIERARAELARAEATLHHWQRELEIDDRLLEQGAVSRTRRDQTALSLENAVRASESAAAGVREAEAVASMGVLRAPMAGVVASIERAPGEPAMAGQPVVQLTAGPRRIRVDVLETDIGGIGTGTDVSISGGRCGVMRGSVVSIEPTVRPPLRSMRAFVEADSACLSGVASGTELSVTFHVRPTSAALLLPASAIDIRGGQPRVYRLREDDTVQAVPVALGVQRDSLQQVIGTVLAGDRIVTSGRTNIRGGERVRVRSLVTQTEGMP